MTELQQFQMIKSGKAIMRGVSKKPTTGDLLMDGKPIEFNKSFALLNMIKNEMIKQGFRKEQFKITYNK